MESSIKKRKVIEQPRQMRLTDLPTHLLSRILQPIVTETLLQTGKLLAPHCPFKITRGTQFFRRRERTAIPESLIGIAALGRTMATALVLALGKRVRKVHVTDIVDHPSLSLISCSPVLEVMKCSMRCECRRCIGFEKCDPTRVLRVLSNFDFPALKVLDITNCMAFQTCQHVTHNPLPVASVVLNLFRNVSEQLKMLSIPNHRSLEKGLGTNPFPNLKNLSIAGPRAIDWSTQACWKPRGGQGFITGRLLIALACCPNPPSLSELTLTSYLDAPSLPTFANLHKLKDMVSSVVMLHLIRDRTEGFLLQEPNQQPELNFISLFPGLTSLHCNAMPTAQLRDLYLSHCPKLVDVAIGPVEVLSSISPWLFDERQDLPGLHVTADKLGETVQNVQRVGRQRILFEIQASSMAGMVCIIKEKVPVRSLTIDIGTSSLHMLQTLCVDNNHTLHSLNVTFFTEKAEHDQDATSMDSLRWGQFTSAISNLKNLVRLIVSCDACQYYGGSPNETARGVITCLKKMGRQGLQASFSMSCEVKTTEQCMQALQAHIATLQVLRQQNRRMRTFSLRVGWKYSVVDWDVIGRDDKVRWAMTRICDEFGKCERNLPRLRDGGVGARFANEFMMWEESGLTRPFRCYA